jgi:NTP pyrophosphatase (non-canonical NTP hydrolase)
MKTSLTCNEKEEQIFSSLVENFGSDAQVLKCVEELSELMVSLMHYRDGKADKWQVCEEVADCIIMCRQMANLFDRNVVDGFIIEKMNLLKKRTECLAV